MPHVAEGMLDRDVWGRWRWRSSASSASSTLMAVRGIPFAAGGMVGGLERGCSRQTVLREGQADFQALASPDPAVEVGPTIRAARLIQISVRSVAARRARGVAAGIEVGERADLVDFHGGDLIAPLVPCEYRIRLPLTRHTGVRGAGWSAPCGGGEASSPGGLPAAEEGEGGYYIVRQAPLKRTRLHFSATDSARSGHHGFLKLQLAA